MFQFLKNFQFSLIFSNIFFTQNEARAKPENWRSGRGYFYYKKQQLYLRQQKISNKLMW